MAKIKIFKDTNNNKNIPLYTIYDVLYAKENVNGTMEEFVAIVLEVFDDYIICELAKGDNILTTNNITWIQRGNLVDENKQQGISLRDVNSNGPNILSYDKLDFGKQEELNITTYDPTGWSLSGISVTSTITTLDLKQTGALDGILLNTFDLGAVYKGEVFYTLGEYIGNYTHESFVSSIKNPITNLNFIGTSIMPVRVAQGRELIRLEITTDSPTSYLGFKTSNTSTEINARNISMYRMSDFLDQTFGLDVKIGKIGANTGLWAKTIQIGETINDVNIVIDKDGLVSTNMENNYTYTTNSTLSKITTGENDVDIFKVAKSYTDTPNIAIDGFSIRYNSVHSYLELATSNTNGPLNTSLYVTQSGDLHQLENAFFSKDVSINDIRIMDNEILNYTDSTDDGVLKLNYSSYNGDDFKYRTFSVGNGRGYNIFSAVGDSTGSYVHFTTKIQNHILSIKDEHINNYSEDSDTATLYLNSKGYSNGTTRFRNTIIGNGKGSDTFKVNGSEDRIYNNAVVNFKSISSFPSIVDSKIADMLYESHIDATTSKQIDNMYMFSSGVWRPVGTLVFDRGTTEEDADLAGAKEGDIIII